MSQELTQYFRDYIDWVNGKPSTVFSGNYGLCPLLHKYLAHSPNKSDVLHEFRMLLFRDFPKTLVYPFNKDGEHYRLEAEGNSCHKNINRIDWVRKQINA